MAHHMGTPHSFLSSLLHHGACILLEHRPALPCIFINTPVEPIKLYPLAEPRLLYLYVPLNIWVLNKGLQNY